MWRVDWSDGAIADLEGIAEYIEQFDLAAAARIGARITREAQSLEQFPRLGRPIGRGMRQLSSVYPYQIRYKVRRDHVEIIAVRHGARRG